jgi:hypothetical protein
MSAQSLDNLTVTVGTKRYVVRYSLAAAYRLSAMGIGVDTLVSTINARVAAGGGLQVFVDVGSTMLGNFDADMNWRSLNVSPADLADRLVDNEAAELINTVKDELGKKLGLTWQTSGSQSADPIPTEVPSDGGLQTGPSEPVQAASA